MKLKPSRHFVKHEGRQVQWNLLGSRLLRFGCRPVDRSYLGAVSPFIASVAISSHQPTPTDYSMASSACIRNAQTRSAFIGSRCGHRSSPSRLGQIGDQGSR